jgi:hypothetical protein
MVACAGEPITTTSGRGKRPQRPQHRLAFDQHRAVAGRPAEWLPPDPGRLSQRHHPPVRAGAFFCRSDDLTWGQFQQPPPQSLSAQQLPVGGQLNRRAVAHRLGGPVDVQPQIDGREGQTPQFIA